MEYKQEQVHSFEPTAKERAEAGWMSIPRHFVVHTLMEAACKENK